MGRRHLRAWRGGLARAALAAWLATGVACAAGPPPAPVTAPDAAVAGGAQAAPVAPDPQPPAWPEPPLPGAASAAGPASGGGTSSDDRPAPAVAAENPAGEEPVGEPAAPGRPVRRELIVIDQGSSAVRPTPGELARATRRATAGPNAPTISNENLAEYGREARVTVSGGPAGEGENAPAAVPTEADGLTDEESWRRRAREIREAWRRTADEIATLEEAAADLRWRFYAADDPWVRDSQIKPEWDRVLDRLTAAQQELSEFPGRIDELVERGRREGALPGWLREGIELEPRGEVPSDEEPGTSEPVEPPELDEGQGGGGGTP